MGFARNCLPILLAGLTGDYALLMLGLGWITRAILLGSLITGFLVVLINYEKHHASEAFDDRLTNERMAAALARHIAGVKARNEKRYKD